MANKAGTATRSDVIMVDSIETPVQHNPDGFNDDYELRRQEVRDHGGEVVARVEDGRTFYAKTYEALYQVLATNSISTHDAWLE